VLARLDFAADALSLNLGALTRFGNPFLVDVAASTLCAVAIAEATRGRKSRAGSPQNGFAPPPTPPASGEFETVTPEGKAKSLKESLRRDWAGVDARSKHGRAKAGQAATASLSKFLRALKSETGVDGDSTASRAPSRADKDIELGEWYGQSHAQLQAGSAPGVAGKETKAERLARKQREKEERLPFVARAVLGLLKYGVKAVVWVLMLVFRFLAAVVRMLVRRVDK
jgi:hypothetical protein